MFTLTVYTDHGSAFTDDPIGELQRILHKVADDINVDDSGVGRVFDVNGNRCGRWEFA
jgi:hypothetical protein